MIPRKSVSKQVNFQTSKHTSEVPEITNLTNDQGTEATFLWFVWLAVLNIPKKHMPFFFWVSSPQSENYS